MNIVIKRWLGGVAIFTTTLSATAFAGNMDWVKEHLSKFKANPKGYATEHQNVSKYDPETGERIQTPLFFPQNTITPTLPDGSPNPAFRDFIFQKDALEKSAERHRKLKQKQGRAEFLANDMAANLVDQLAITNISKMDQYKTASVETQPWSDDYWPIYKGGLSARYADPQFPGRLGDKDWKRMLDYVSTRNATDMDDLSPAEKFDILLGDTAGDKSDLNGPGWSLTKANLREGLHYYRERGSVETWMGHCHGWAAAAMMISRPTSVVTVRLATGQRLNFYPSDIKGLSTLLWAQGKFRQKSISGRCNQKKPATDPSNGRILAKECFDTNPGTWHLVMVNQIGVSRRSLVIDATYDYEVWNQPALGYDYVYFNPVSGDTVESWKDGLIKLPDVNDQFAKYRSPKAKYAVGVAMKFVYMAETAPTHNASDHPKADRRVAVNYLYDIELDENLNIIGGEWYHNEHPDFLWTPTPTAKVMSVGDSALANSGISWDGASPLPAEWKEIGVRTAQRGQPLAGIINALVARSAMR